VRFEPFEGDASPEAVNRAMETMIRRIPDQYFWGYNRYKTPLRAAEPAGAPAAGDGPGGAA
jgi:KDO2-lipid IV(A) lauroyltransferase